MITAKQQGSLTKQVVAVTEITTYRRMIKALHGNGSIQLLGNAGDIQELYHSLSMDPDVVVLDLDHKNDEQIFEIIKNVRDRLPGVVLLFISTRISRSLYTQLMTSLDYWSFITKSLIDDPVLLAKAIKSKQRGLILLDKHSLPKSYRKYKLPVQELTPQQHRVLRLIAQGYSNAATAENLCISKRTVENIIRSVYQKLGIDTSEYKSQPRVLATLRYLGELNQAD